MQRHYAFNITGCRLLTFVFQKTRSKTSLASQKGKSKSQSKKPATDVDAKSAEAKDDAQDHGAEPSTGEQRTFEEKTEQLLNEPVDNTVDVMAEQSPPTSNNNLALGTQPVEDLKNEPETPSVDEPFVISCKGMKGQWMFDVFNSFCNLALCVVVGLITSMPFSSVFKDPEKVEIRYTVFL